MIIPVTKLPSNFKPYTFKSFKMNALTLQQAIDLGSGPTLRDCVKLLQVLVNDEIDASKLVPIDVRYLIAMLSFHAFPKQTWTLSLVCPNCGESHNKSVTMKDFPPIPSLDMDDPYPLEIDDGTHIYQIGYPTIDAVDNLLAKVGGNTTPEAVSAAVTNLDIIVPYILTIDGESEGIREKLLALEDFGVLNVMLETIQKFFVDETYSTQICPKCTKEYRVPLSAVEVTQYTPFPDSSAVSKYKTNFRL